MVDGVSHVGPIVVCWMTHDSLAHSLTPARLAAVRGPPFQPSTRFLRCANSDVPDGDGQTLSAMFRYRPPDDVVVFGALPRNFLKNRSIRASVYSQRLCSIDSCVSSGKTMSS